MPHGLVITIWSVHEDWQENWRPRAITPEPPSPLPLRGTPEPKRPSATYQRLAASGDIGSYKVIKTELQGRVVADAGEAAIVWMEVHADSWDGIIQACKDNYDPRVSFELGGATLAEQFGPEHFGRWDGPKGLEFGRTQAQLLILERIPVRRRRLIGRDFDPARAIDHELLRQLLFKDVDISYRPLYSPVSFPADINAPSGTFVAVWAGNSIVAGYGEKLKNRIEEMVRVVAQVVVAKEACGQLIDYTRRQFSDPSAEARRDPNRVTQRAGILFDLQLRYTFAVEAHLPNVAEVGGRPLDSYHRAVATEMGLVNRAEATARLLDRLAQAVRADRDNVNLIATLTGARAARVVAVVVATLGPIIGAVALFATLATIPAQGAFIGEPARAAAAAALLVVAAGGLGFTLSRIAARGAWSWGAAKPLAVVCGLSATALLCVVAGGAQPFGSRWGPIAAASVLALVGVLLISTTLDLEQPSRSGWGSGGPGTPDSTSSNAENLTNKERELLPPPQPDQPDHLTSGAAD